MVPVRLPTSMCKAQATSKAVISLLRSSVFGLPVEGCVDNCGEFADGISQWIRIRAVSGKPTHQCTDINMTNKKWWGKNRINLSYLQMKRKIMMKRFGNNREVATNSDYIHENFYCCYSIACKFIPAVKEKKNRSQFQNI